MRCYVFYAAFKLTQVFHGSVLLLTMNFVITLSNWQYMYMYFSKNVYFLVTKDIQYCPYHWSDSPVALCQ